MADYLETLSCRLLKHGLFRVRLCDDYHGVHGIGGRSIEHLFYLSGPAFYIHLEDPGGGVVVVGG